LTDCRDCKDYRECPSLRKDDYGKYTIKGQGKDWYHYGEIRWCPFQVMWILDPKNRSLLRWGNWPKDPDGSDDNSGQRIIKTEATFTKPILILAEVKIRLERTGKDGKILVAQIEADYDFNSLDRDARDALMYVKGFRRKKDNFVKWKKERKYRRKHTKRYEGNESNGHKHKYILDENNFGRCKCGETKQFPIEKKLELRPSEIIAMENLGSIVNCDPGSPLNASVYGVEFDK